MSWFGEWDGFDEEMQNAPDIFAIKPKTNADRIRAMTDEEMASILLDLFADFYAVEWHLTDILDWLKEDAKEIEEEKDRD